MALLTNSLKLNNGFEMPLLGLGTWKSKAGEVEVAVSLLDFTRIGWISSLIFPRWRAR